MKKISLNHTLSVSRTIALATVFTIVISTIGANAPLTAGFASSIFNHDTATLVVKVLLILSLVIILANGRPRSYAERNIIGFAAVVSLMYAVATAITGTLAIGDAPLVFIASLLSMHEAIEARLGSAPNPANRYHQARMS